jgi:geranylgeranyl diphosphate synthase, type I
VSGPAPSTPTHLALPRDLVERRLGGFFEAELTDWSSVSPLLVDPIKMLRDVTMLGGKRLRPALCYWAFIGAGGEPEDPRIMDAAAGLELFHVGTLIHDDIIDAAAARRGQAPTHLEFAHRHRANLWRGDANEFGQSVAIVLGDLAFFSATKLLESLPVGARQMFHQMASDVGKGQYLELVSTARRVMDPGISRLIARYKAAKHSIEAPLHIGAALAGRLDLAAALSRYALPIGEAFQLTDDLLGVFGDPSVTRKPVGDDLRQGKPTLLLALLSQRAGGATAELLRQLEVDGSDDEAVRRLINLLVQAGVDDDVRKVRDALIAEAVEAVAHVDLLVDARDALVELAQYVGVREV